MARDLTRVVDVAAPVQDRHVHAPRWRKCGSRRTPLPSSVVRGEDERAEERGAEHDGRDCDQPRDRSALGGRFRYRQAGELPRLPVVDPERSPVHQCGDQRVVCGREPIDAALLEPARLFVGETRAPSRFLERQLSLKPRAREGRLRAVRLERLDELHAGTHSGSVGGHPPFN